MTPADGDGARLVAAVDCGSNSTRLLLAAVRDGRVHAIDRRTHITRLAAGVDTGGQLSPDAIARVAEVLEDYSGRWRAERVDRVAISATSAVRDAGNAAAFTDAVERVAGVPPAVLSGRDEASLTLYGATAGRPGRRVVCDIGGGSTELVAGDAATAHWVSLQLGSIRLRERHLHHDPPSVHEYAALLADIDAVLAAEPDHFAMTDGTPLLAVAGTATTIAAVALDTADADVSAVDGAVLTAAQVMAVIEDLAWITSAQRRAHPAIPAGREDVIVAGGLLLARVMNRYGYAAVEIRVADLLDGMALRAAAGDWPPAPPERRAAEASEGS